MASQLAYEMDGALKKELLKFWGLKKLDQFFDRPLDPGRGYASLLSLDPVASTGLAAILKAFMATGALAVVMGRYKFNAGTEAELPRSKIKGVEDLETLERLHLVHWRRDRTNLASEGDRVALTAKLLELIDGAHEAVACTTAPTPRGLPPAVPTGCEDFLAEVWESAWYTRPVPAGIDAGQLFQDGHLIPALDPEGRPGLVAVWPTVEPPAPGDLGFKAEEAPALFFHQLHSLLFPFRTRKRQDDDRKLGLFPMEEAVMAVAVQAYGKHPSRKVRKSLRWQASWLLSRRPGPIRAMLGRLVRALGETAVVSHRGLRRLMAREVHLRGPLPMELDAFIPHLRDTGLVVDTGTHLAFPIQFLRPMGGLPKTADAAPGGSLVLDTDLSISLYRQVLSPHRLHFLLSLGTPTRGEHMWSIHLESARIPYHLWLGRTFGRSRKFFRREARQYWNDVAEDHLAGLFRQSEVMKSAVRRVLWTHSRSALERMKSALEGERITAEYEAAEGDRSTHQIIFRRRKDFAKAKLLLSRLRIPGI